MCRGSGRRITLSNLAHAGCWQAATMPKIPPRSYLKSRVGCWDKNRIDYCYLLWSGAYLRVCCPEQATPPDVRYVTNSCGACLRGGRSFRGSWCPAAEPALGHLGHLGRPGGGTRADQVIPTPCPRG